MERVQAIGVICGAVRRRWTKSAFDLGGQRRSLRAVDHRFDAIQGHEHTDPKGREKDSADDERHDSK